MNNHVSRTIKAVALLALTSCAPLPLRSRIEGEPIASRVPVERCLEWRASQRGWAVVGASASSIAGVSGLSSVVMPRTDSVTLTLGLVVMGASALAAGSGVAVTYLSADYAAAGCAGP
jgi:hypothetical protein